MVPGVVQGRGADGVDVIETDASNCLNVPAEALMMEAPIRVHRVALTAIPVAPGSFVAGLVACSNTSCWKAKSTVTYRGERHLCEAAGRRTAWPAVVPAR